MRYYCQQGKVEYLAAVMLVAVSIIADAAGSSVSTVYRTCSKPVFISCMSAEPRLQSFMSIVNFYLCHVEGPLGSRSPSRTLHMPEDMSPHHHVTN